MEGRGCFLGSNHKPLSFWGSGQEVGPRGTSEPEKRSKDIQRNSQKDPAYICIPSVDIMKLLHATEHIDLSWPFLVFFPLHHFF
jgi:hypothetical protein